MILKGKDDEEHLDHLEEVLNRLKEHGLRGNCGKGELYQTKITYCGHVVDHHKVHETQQKVNSVVNGPRPENMPQVRLFSGLVKYYHKFLPNLATTLNPLDRLLEQGKPWRWTAECEGTFVSVKKSIASDMVLTHYDPKRPLKLACDASSVRVGVVFSAQNDP